MRIVTVDKKGRITIPKEKRDELGLSEEDKLIVSVEEGEIRLKPLVKKQVKVKAGRKWGKEAFLKAGEALFAGEK